MTIAALIVAAGRGSRAGGGLPKQYRSVAGMPVLRRTLLAFGRHPRIDLILPVIHPDDQALYDECAAGLPKVLPAVAGGATRQQSVHAGLKALPEGVETVLIHDGARPFISSDLIDRVLEGLTGFDGSVAALPIVDTLRRAGTDGLCGDTVDRTSLYRMQTPQAFRLSSLRHAFETAPHDTFTDDVAVAQAAGLAIRTVDGDERNFKITEPDDFLRAELQMISLSDIRTGHGYDVHKFGPGDAVNLGGLRIPHEQGLVGHSDADVALHALTDALLGTIAAGDIGTHFPPSDPQWKGASSDRFLRFAQDLVGQTGGEVLHVDLTIVCEAPKIGPHRTAIQQRIAEILTLDPSQVSVKATTSEGLGFTGRREGIAVTALATVRVPRSGGAL